MAPISRRGSEVYCKKLESQVHANVPPTVPERSLAVRRG
jgi:hypothetical protein